MRMPASVIVTCVLAACYRAPTASPTEPHPARATGSNTDARVLARTDERAAPSRAGMSVSGCNAGCEDCSLGDYKSFVIGTLERTKAHLFPSPDPPQPGYQCGAEVAIGDRVTLRAHSTVGLTIAAWTPFFDTDACPCTTPTDVCTFVVTPELAAHHPRIYCGAVWRRATAQIGN